MGDVPQPRFGPGSRGVNKGRPKAADELARRAAERDKAKEAESAQPSEPATPPASSPKETPSSSSDSRFGGKFGVSDAGGAVLALVFWSWVVLPILQGGPERMKNTLRAKFFNKGPKGEWLP